MSSIHEQADVLVEVGSRHVERLPGRAAAGYEWIPTVEGPAGVAAVSIDYDDTPVTGPRMGSSRDELVEILGLEPGAVTLRLRQVRAAPKAEPLAERVIRIVVAQPPERSLEETS